MSALEQTEARTALDQKVSEWTGKHVDDAGVQDIIAKDTRSDR
jgi:hypothetical protein